MAVTERILQGCQWLSAIVWGPAGVALLAGAGVWMSVGTGFFQFRHLGLWMRQTLGAILCDKSVTAHTKPGDGAISPFQSLCTALAGTLGIGNLVGVAAAITGGGPGAVFWMWVMALIGMMTSYAENLLGACYRRRAPDGRWLGGAMYYLADGLGAKPGCRLMGRVLAGVFAVCCLLASFGMGNMSQTNAIAANLDTAFGVPPAVAAVVLAAATGGILLGGIRRVASVTERLVPVMALFYLGGALVVLVVRADALPAALGAIFRGAFSGRALGGAALGQTILWGAKRGAFSNEAGLGSTVMVNAASDLKDPVHQGMWGIFEVFADTIVVCTLTALVLLATGAVDLQTGAAVDGLAESALVGWAFGSVFGSIGPKLIAVSVLLFAYSTVLGWSHYGSMAAEYLWGKQGVRVYRATFVLLTAAGALMKLDFVWALSDLFNGLMMQPNLIAVFALRRRVFAETQRYFGQLQPQKRVG